jgi:predicted transcriptional regulator
MAMTLRTDDELDEALAELAKAEGVSKQEVVRRAVLDRRGRLSHRERIDAIATQAMTDYQDALDRLGTV